ncbi:MAG: GDSL-type esterase/lipase family protein [Xanthomonadales bacterium]|nr:GDSL-type esterase/lipase family protein [Xanthomonadales bacterium]
MKTSVVKISVVLQLFFLLATANLSAQVKVACVGNSITSGPSSDSYPAQLQTLLDSTCGVGVVEVQNFGHSARTMVKGHPTRSYWDSPRYTAAKNFNPDISIILLGTNDARTSIWDIYSDDFSPDYLDMIDEFKAVNPNMEFLLGYPTPIFTFTDWNDNVVNGVIPRVDTALGEANTQLIDFNTPFLGSMSLFPDNVHPNIAGYGLMASIAHDRLLEMGLISDLCLEDNEGLIFVDGFE